MALSLSTYLKLRIDSNLTDDAKFNLYKIDNLASVYQIDSTNLVKLRSRTNILLQPEDPSIGGSGEGGTISIGSIDQPADAINLNSPIVNITGQINSTNLSTDNISLNNNNYTLSLLAGSLTENFSLTFPVNYGTVNQVLTSNGAGQLIWTTVSGLSVGQESTVTWLNADGLTKTITHNFNSRNIMVQIIDPNDNYRNVEVDSIQRPTLSTIIVESSIAPPTSWLVLLKQIGS